MDLSAARKTLTSGPLKFGNADQIAAHEFLVAAELAADALAKCPHGSGKCDECDGEGECEHCGHECDECDGTGVSADCECFNGISEDVILAASTVLDERDAKKRKRAHPREELDV